MTIKNLPPLPWTYLTDSPVGKPDGYGFVYLLDANGRKIAALWGKPEEKIATATLILDAAEEHAQRPAEGPDPTIAEVLRDA